jgi:hypothetical protein
LKIYLGEKMQALEAVQAVLAVQKARKRIPEHMEATHPYSVNAIWTYYLRGHHEPEGESCVYCQMFDGQSFTGDQLRTVFPDHYWVGDDIYPNVHKTLWDIDSTCSCLLIMHPEGAKELNLDMWSSVGTDWTETPDQSNKEK